MPSNQPIGLTEGQVQDFIDNGFIKLESAFSVELAQQCRDVLWREMGLSPTQPENWRQPVVRLGWNAQQPFVEAANTPRLHRAYDQLVGEGGWLAPPGLGTFVVRFPLPEPPGDDGWHVDMSFGTDSPDFMEWRINVASRGRALLMLFLLSDVGAHDAPTRLRRGSHAIIARDLLPHGEAGVSLRQLAMDGFASTAHCDVELACGTAGTVYLCHPFIVHAAQPHRGRQPRFLAQPPLLPKAAIDSMRPQAPVQVAIHEACRLA